MIVCCDMQFEDGPTQTMLWKNFNFVMAKNGVSKVNFKGFMIDIAHDNWKTMRKIYRDGDPSLPMVEQECTCLFHYSTNLDKVTQ